jgi:hypothetical protein
MTDQPKEPLVEGKPPSDEEPNIDTIKLLALKFIETILNNQSTMINKLEELTKKIDDLKIEQKN